jgi:hypothetical protein
MAARFLGSEEPEGPNHPETTRNSRREARVEDCHKCAYEFCENGEGTAPAVRQGQVFTLNRSAHGVLLLMGEVPQVDQLIHVYNVRLGWRRSTMIYQVRWTRSMHVTSQSELFLVGCRLTTGVMR